jgi:hypothetical protein
MKGTCFIHVSQNTVSWSILLVAATAAIAVQSLRHEPVYDRSACTATLLCTLPHGEGCMAVDEHSLGVLVHTYHLTRV